MIAAIAHRDMAGNASRNNSFISTVAINVDPAGGPASLEIKCMEVPVPATVPSRVQPRRLFADEDSLQTPKKLSAADPTSPDCVSSLYLDSPQSIPKMSLTNEYITLQDYKPTAGVTTCLDSLHSSRRTHKPAQYASLTVLIAIALSGALARALRTVVDVEDVVVSHSTEPLADQPSSITLPPRLMFMRGLLQKQKQHTTHEAHEEIPWSAMEVSAVDASSITLLPPFHPSLVAPPLIAWGWTQVRTRNAKKTAAAAAGAAVPADSESATNAHSSPLHVLGKWGRASQAAVGKAAKTLLSRNFVRALPRSNTLHPQ